MKLSDKILLGFFGSIFIYLTAAFTEVRLTGTPNIINDKNSIAETVDIAGVTHIVLENLDKQVHVVGSDRAQLEVRSFSKDLLPKVTYRVSGDSLVVSSIELKDENTRFRITIFVPKKELKKLTLRHSAAVVRSLESSVLNISQESSSIFLSESHIERISAESYMSFLEISATTLDSLSAASDRSRVNVYTSVSFVNGSLKNGSILRVDNISEIQLRKDDGSSLNIY